MVAVRRVPAGDVGRVRDCHERFTGQDVAAAVVREWYEDAPELFVGAYEGVAGDGRESESGGRERGGDGCGGSFVGYCLGVRRAEDCVELKGLGVAPDWRRDGVGTRLVAALESAAVDLGAGRVTLGSAGGYVDEFYASLGYEPESVLVRLPADETPGDGAGDFEVLRERMEGDTRKLYVDAEAVGQPSLRAVREAFGDEDAVYVMEKTLGLD